MVPAGAAVLTLSADDEGQPVLRQCRPAALPSAFETVAELRVLREGEDGPIAVPAVCSEQTAKLIAHADNFLSALPPIRILAQSPVLVESDGELAEVTGYHRESGVLAFGTPSEKVERSFAHVCETGGARRTWLRGLEKINKRYQIVAAARNLGLLMRKVFGIGKPRSLQGGMEGLLSGFWTCLVVLRSWSDVQRPSSRLPLPQTLPTTKISDRPRPIRPPDTINLISTGC